MSVWQNNALFVFAAVCNSGHKDLQNNVISFRFPARQSNLLTKWLSFVNCTK